MVNKAETVLVVIEERYAFLDNLVSKPHSCNILSLAWEHGRTVDSIFMSKVSVLEMALSNTGLSVQ